MTINTYFDKVFYINSKKRGDRLKNMVRRLSDLDIKAERFEAILGGAVDKSTLKINPTKKVLNNGELGCYLSHRQIWQTIKEKGYKKVLILEDDAEFCPDFLNEFSEKIDTVPDFDLLYFGHWNYDHKGDSGKTKTLKEEISKGVFKADRCWLTHAYAVNEKCVDYLLEKTEEIYSCIDSVLADVQSPLDVIAFYPNLIKQDKTKSSLR
jgi:GR25 family glycosyltransferase involved in LPS biosynthesis